MKENIPHNFSGSLLPNRVIRARIATAFFFDNIVVVEINQGVTLSYKNGFSLLLKGLSYLGSKPFIYVSNRVHSYALNPNDYKYLENVPTLKGLAIIKSKATTIDNETLEKKFFKKPFKVFESLEEGIAWGHTILENAMKERQNKKVMSDR